VVEKFGTYAGTSDLKVSDKAASVLALSTAVASEYADLKDAMLRSSYYSGNAFQKVTDLTLADACSMGNVIKFSSLAYLHNKHRSEWMGDFSEDQFAAIKEAFVNSKINLDDYYVIMDFEERPPYAKSATPKKRALYTFCSMELAKACNMALNSDLGKEALAARDLSMEVIDFDKDDTEEVRKKKEEREHVRQEALTKWKNFTSDVFSKASDTSVVTVTLRECEQYELKGKSKLLTLYPLYIDTLIEISPAKSEVLKVAHTIDTDLGEVKPKKVKSVTDSKDLERLGLIAKSKQLIIDNDAEIERLKGKAEKLESQISEYDTLRFDEFTLTPDQKEQLLNIDDNGNKSFTPKEVKMALEENLESTDDSISTLQNQNVELQSRIEELEDTAVEGTGEDDKDGDDSKESNKSKGYTRNSVFLNKELFDFMTAVIN
jgi:hypothetical protein